MASKVLGSSIVDKEFQVVWEDGLVSVLFRGYLLQDQIGLESVLSGLVAQEVLGLHDKKESQREEEKGGGCDGDEKNHVIVDLNVKLAKETWHEQESKWVVGKLVIRNLLEKGVDDVGVDCFLDHIMSDDKVDVGEADVIKEDQI